MEGGQNSLLDAIADANVSNSLQAVKETALKAVCVPVCLCAVSLSCPRAEA